MFKTRSYLAEVQLKPTAPVDPPAFPFTLPAIRSLERLPLHPNVTFLVGENGQRCQFIIATHSPILMAYPNALIYEFGEHGIREITYQDTEHYRVTHDFLVDPERMLKVLMGEE